MVVISAVGSRVICGRRPAAITTIIVSPMARETASNTAAITPGRAAGITTCFTVSERVAPMAKAPSRSDCGTALMTSSDSEDTKGMIITPITRPAARALVEEAAKNSSGMTGRPFSHTAAALTAGATTSRAKKP